MTSSVHPRHCDDEPLSTEDAQNPLGFHTSTQIGKLFTLARRELNVSLQAVSQKIHVRATYLEAIEKGDLDKLPSPLYAAGFIRLYARYVQLDGEEILRRLDLAKEYSLSHGTLLHGTPYVAPHRFSLVLSGILTCLSLSLIGVVVWYNPLPPLSEGWDSLHSILLPSEVLSQKQPLEVIETPSQNSDTIQTSHLEKKSDSDAPSMMKKTTESRSDSSENKLMIKHEEVATSEDAANTESLKTLPLNEATKDHRSQIEEKSLTFFAHDDCWLDIRRDENVLFSAVLKAGKTYTLDSIEGIEISVGNAPSLEMKYGNAALDPLSRMDRVVKHVRLDLYVQQHAHTPNLKQ